MRATKRKASCAVCWLLAALMIWHTPTIAYALPVGVHHRHVNSANKIALTFDDGPHPRYTMEIISILEEYGIHATFFFVGENVINYPDVARAVSQRGHEIGNHTHTHVCPSPKNGRSVLGRELEHCERAIQRVTDTSPKLFRPPTGSWNDTLYELARAHDYDIVLWNIDTLDWAHTPPEQISAHVLERAQSGDIILMHDYHSNGCTTTEALRLMIPVLLARGFHFVTVSELIGSK